MKLQRFDAPAKVRLDDIPADPPDSVKKGDARDRFDELSGELFELQDLMWGARTHSVLMVLQGRDAAGKDGTVKHLSDALNPRGVMVTSFGVPTLEERQHDFLWRVHRHAPRAGEVGIFNRSHYEDVLVARVKDLVAPAIWKERYELINGFERNLAKAGCIVLKFFLHITKEEQRQRLLEREKDPSDAWKLSVEDWRDRERWDDYTEAYEDAIGRCASKDAPWIVVPANAKWYRNLVVAEAVAAAMRPHRAAWREGLDEQGKLVRRDLKAWRAEHPERGQ
ncbi:MAG TPA: PPK2 family polyphosphate kinase [Myxococcales bacterium]|nr:PPK2 family polyphosphate kinase [Myxococcales bacterium]